MSAVSLSPDPAGERRRAAEMSIGRVSDHITTDTWPDRVGTDVDLREAWRDAEPVHYPSASNACVARLYEMEVILLARQGALMTCIPLWHRAEDEQQYIRSQVTDQ
ncbi:hypothetical protein EL22_19955 [Halostagnicola sp. A56]|uniref:hypothetical protein n=1 Tax=Halostagnicola sp. A56 TaxID=1495067 RepID=UPI0004A078C1|nr:hypothetical protein [Halostagnicola sp. A56]KDE59578.1 hypothetical protein EL22_19955 [Halostagnicola sp. A56]